MHPSSTIILAAASSLAACALAAPARADDGRPEYTHWAATSTSPTAGTGSTPGVGFPPATYRTDASRVQTPSGQSAFLNAGTPFGQRFGSSRGRDYLMFGTAAGRGPSTTTVHFASPTPAGHWGFTLGDVDADTVTISATDAHGREVTGARLGWRGAFNFCSGTQLPPACKGVTGTDLPAWDPATRRLTGQGNDTQGSSGWFMPTVPLRSLTIRFEVLTGIPSAQLWMAADWPGGKPDIAVTKSTHTRRVSPGGTVRYTLRITNHGTADEPSAEIGDDLADVVDDAVYNHDATASGGTVSYRAPVLTWRGPVAAGQTRTITYSVTVAPHPKGNGRIRNVVIGHGPRLTCHHGSGHGCAAPTVIVRKHGAGCRTAFAVPACRKPF